ncbi:MAG: hypothetical protein CMJ32_10515 [Phycisphaerae bacterium]|nr:hypothetical protein [Phycisphaerae bacterium]
MSCFSTNNPALLRPSRGNAAFTLVELLVVIALIAILAAIAVPTVQSVRQAATRSSEMSAARSLITAWAQYSFDNKGQLLPGHKTGLDATDEHGNSIPSIAIEEVAARFPWRIAPYLGSNLSALYSGEQASELQEMSEQDYASFVYQLSLFPSFGLNSCWVGGDTTTGAWNPAFISAFGQYYASRMSSIRNPSRLLVFGSGRALTNSPESGSGITEGFFRLQSPWFSSRRWAEQYDPLDPASYGNISARHEGQAIIANAGGSVESVDVEELDDMRRWADQADDPDWTISPVP